MTYYKYLSTDGTAFHGGNGRWSLPTQNDDGTWDPGDWMPPVEGPIVPCINGYHLCQSNDLLDWFAPALYIAEGRGDSVRDGNKTVFREARLLRPVEAYTECMLRLFACDCAEHVLELFESQCPDDDRPRNCIAVTRRYVSGDASDEELAAARDAALVAGDAAGDAAWVAARDAAWVAGDAARATARVAARVAARAAGDAAEREWQVARLLELLALPREEVA